MSAIVPLLNSKPNEFCPWKTVQWHFPRADTWRPRWVPLACAARSCPTSSAESRPWSYGFTCWNWKMTSSLKCHIILTHIHIIYSDLFISSHICSYLFISIYHDVTMTYPSAIHFDVYHSVNSPFQIISGLPHRRCLQESQEFASALATLPNQILSPPGIQPLRHPTWEPSQRTPWLHSPYHPPDDWKTESCLAVWISFLVGGYTKPAIICNMCPSNSKVLKCPVSNII